MAGITRRETLLGGTLALGAATMPALAQGDMRPAITIAVQKIAGTNTLEILYEASNVGTRHYNLYAEPLIDTDWTGDLALRPGLAESWKRIDEKTIELKLRPGVTFHNGDPLTAEDVVFSFGPERMFGLPEEAKWTAGQPRDPRWAPAQARGTAKAAFPAFDKFEIIDPLTVRFINRQPDVTLEGRLSLRHGVIYSKRHFEASKAWLDWARGPVGTGPYKVREFKPDTVLVLDAHDAYWGGRPPLKSIRFVEVPEVSSRINGLLSGEYDFVCDIPPDQIKTIEANARYEVLGGLITNHRILAYDTTFPALKDPRVRQAMNHAIDRQVIVDELWGGRTKVPRGLQFEFFGPLYVEDWDVPKYDPALAKKLLAEAGYKGEPIPYKVLNNYYTNQVSTAQTLVEMWRAVGLNIEMKMVENAGQLLEKPRAIRDLSSTSFYNDPVSFFAVTFGKTGSMQATGEWVSPETDRLIPELENGTDMARRKAVYRRLLEITERDDPCITVVHQTANFTAKRKDIRWKPAKSFVMDFRGRNFAVALP